MNEEVHLKEGWLTAAELQAEAPPDEWLASAWGTGRGILVGHAWNGVLWGELAEGHLELTGQTLSATTLVDLRLFDENRELRVWRKDGRLEARLVAEGDGDADVRGRRYAAWQERSYLLLGESRDGALVGPAGQRHRPPGDPLPGRLRVRHYFERNRETGLLRLVEHRYLGLEATP